MISYLNQKMFLFMILSITLVQCDANESMKCYVCTNFDDPDCNDNPTSEKFIMSCEDYFANRTQTFNTTEKDFFCRKTVEQGLTFNGDPQTMRIIRSCGYLRNQEKSCYRTTDTQVKTETCECYHPLCNTAETQASSSTFFKILIPALCAITFNLS